jgi:hypothetical protein
MKSRIDWPIMSSIVSEPNIFDKKSLKYDVI